MSALEALCDYMLYKSTFTLYNLDLHYIRCEKIFTWSKRKF